MGKPAGERLCRFFVSRETVGGVVLCLVKGSPSASFCCPLGQPCRNRPAEFARFSRCPPGACQRRLLPLPVPVMLIFKCFLVQTVNFILYGVCKFVFLGSPLGHPKGVPCAELSPQVTEGFPATAANRFHKELRFFFSLLKRKKEAKKEKSSRFTCTVRQMHHPKI